MRGESKVSIIPVYKITENNNIPTRNYSKKQISSLAKSISRNGILQPLIVRKSTSYSYELISGKRRLQAAVMAGLSKVPCLVFHCNEIQSAVYSLIDNAQRNQYSYFEQADAINVLVNVYGYSTEKISAFTGDREFKIIGRLKLSEYSAEERDIIASHSLSENTAILLLNIKDISVRKKILNKVVNHKLTHKQAEQLVLKIVSPESYDKNSDRKKVIIKDMRVFYNTINNALVTMKKSGINAVEKITENDEYIQYVIKIPKRVHK